MKLSCIDFLGISEHFTEEENDGPENASEFEFVSKEVMPIIEENYKKGTFPKELISKISKQGFLGCNLPTEYGCGGMSSTAYGLICQELERRFRSKIFCFSSRFISYVSNLYLRFGRAEKKMVTKNG